MSDRRLPAAPRDLKPEGYLFDELEFLDEIEMAAALDVTPETFTGWRKQRIGPPHTEVGRKIIYGKRRAASWLEAGGTRQLHTDE